MKHGLAVPYKGIECDDMRDIGFVCRSFNSDRINNIKNDYGNFVYLSCGKSANLKDIRIQNYDGGIVATHGVDVVGENVANLPVDVLDTHNYIAASEIAIVKAGWGSISEALISGTMLVLLERPDVYEDSYLINKLKKQNLAISISVDKLNNLDIQTLISQAEKLINLNKLKEIQNNAAIAVDYIKGV